MFKLIKFSFVSFVFVFIFSSFAFAADETLAITTYYPSPYGSYNRLSVANQPAFEVKLCSNVVNAGAYVTWETIVNNIGSYYSTATGLFTAPVAGTYIFGFNILLPNATAGEWRFEFWKNGAIYDGIIHYKTTAAVWQGTGGTIVTRLSVGDTIGIRYASGAGAAYIDCNYNRFWGYLLG